MDLQSFPFIIIILWCLLSNYNALSSESESTQMDAIEHSPSMLHCDTAQMVLREHGIGGGRQQLRQVKWVKNGLVIAQFTKIKDSTEWWAPPTYEFDRVNFSLTILRPDDSDDGIYRCETTINYKTLVSTLPAKDIMFKVISKPEAPEKPSVTSFTSRSVTLNWEKVDNWKAPLILRYHIVISVGDGPNTNNNKRVVVNSERTSAVVSSLLPYTTYTFQVQAENMAGKSSLSPPSSPILTKGEPPVASPTIVHVHNASGNTSLVVMWEHPPLSTLHGPLVGYRILCHHIQTGDQREYYLPKHDVNSYVIDGLKPFTKYQIAISADNNYGYSPADTTIVLTAEAAPSSPPIIAGIRVSTGEANTDTDHRSATVIWQAPAQPNGLVTHYTLYYQPVINQARLRRSLKLIHDEEQSVRLAAVDGPIQEYTLYKLDPFRAYEIWLQASNSAGLSPPSVKQAILTDTAAPSVPIISMVRVPNEKTITLHWSKPETYYRRVDEYVVHIEVDNSHDQQTHILANTTALSMDVRVESCVRYVARVRAVTHSIIQKSLHYAGQLSDPQAFMVEVFGPVHAPLVPKIVLYTTLCPPHPKPVTKHEIEAEKLRRSLNNLDVKCQPNLLRGHPDSATQRLNAMRPTLIAVVTMTGCTLLAITACMATVLVLYRRATKKRVQQHEDHYSKAPFLPFDQSEYTSIGVHDFERYMKTMHEEADAKLAEQFNILESKSRLMEEESLVTVLNSTQTMNRHKNRYLNIFSYDHSRVVLKPSAIPGSDYINANYVDGYHKPRAYIATQGPLPHTFIDFWRMVWEQRCGVIVMITNVVESGRRKCDQYWPTEGTEIYGTEYQVRLLNERHTAFYVIRVLAVRNLKCIPRPAERVVFHYHYTHWPDHGVPSNPLPVLSFVRKSSEANRDTCAGPIVVHCSAGVGRSGAYIVVDAMLHQMRERASVNIRAYLQHIRKQRNYLVQTEEQYVFCHDVVLSAIQSGVTEVPTSNLVIYIDRLLGDVDVHSKRTLLEHQYQLVVSSTSSTGLEQVAAQPRNSAQNRPRSLLPMDEGRVLLNGTNGTDDYINASFLQGYSRQDEFIIAQYPLHRSTHTFWQMVWDYGCQTVVVICEPCEDSEPMDLSRNAYNRRSGESVFWPCGDDILEFGHMSVQALNEHSLASSSSGHLQTHSSQVMLTSRLDDYQMNSRIVHAPNWPQTCQPHHMCWELIRGVQSLRQDYQNGPVLVVDELGGNQAATFCALMTLAQQLEHDSGVDVFTLARLYHCRRPGVWPTLSSYQMLYDSVRILLREESTASMATESSRFSLNTNPQSAQCSARVPAAQTLPNAMNTVATYNNNYPECQGMPRDVTV